MGGPKSASQSLPPEAEEAPERSYARREPIGSKIIRTGDVVPPAPLVPRELRAQADNDSAESDELEYDDLGSSSIEIPVCPDEAGTPRTAWASLPPPARSFGRYGVLGRLAVGGMAEIFLAREHIQGDAARHLAIKVLRNHLTGCTPDEEAYFESMFLQEGRVAMQLSHPNICHTYEFGKLDGHYFIAMEWVEGLPVGELLRRAARSHVQMPLDVVLYIVAQVAGALDYAHAARDTQRRPLGVVHRDVTPHNLMLRYDGVVKLLDFGVAKADQSEEETGSGTVKGKFGYMAPEQCAGRPLDGRADIFSLGVCLFEMLTAKRLYSRGGQYETFRAIIEEPVPSLAELRPDLPAELDDILARTLAKNPDERFDAAGLMEAVVSLASRLGFVLSAVLARRWLEEVYGDDLYRGPTLELDPAVLARLEPKQQHPPLSSSEPPPALTPPVSAPQALASHGEPPTHALRHVALGGLLALLVGGGLWWLFERPVTNGWEAPAAAVEARRPAKAPNAITAPAPSAAPDEKAAPVEPEAPEAASAAVEESPSEDPADVPATADPVANEDPPSAAPATRTPAPRPRKLRTRPRRERNRPGFVADPGF